MAPLQRRTRPRSLGLGLLLCLATADARAQTWTFRPVFTLGAGYDSNALFAPGDNAPGDAFAAVGVRAPLTGKLSQRSTLTANYGLGGEFYQDLKNLDRFPSSQEASLGWSYTSPRSNALLGASYTESRRPEDVFPQSGLGFVRGTARNATANAGVGHKLSERTKLDLGYMYSRPFYETIAGVPQEAQGHYATANLARVRNERNQIGLRYQYQLYLRTDQPRDESHIVGLAFNKGFGRSTNLSLFGGARFAGGEVKPDATLTLGHAWRSSQLGIAYSKGRTYIPTTGGFSDTDNASLNYTLGRKRFRFTLVGGYARNRLEEAVDRLGRGNDFESFRGTADAAYKLRGWLGLGATYQYLYQRSENTNFGDRRRNLVQLGLVVTPWSGKDVPGLR